MIQESHFFESCLGTRGAFSDDQRSSFSHHVVNTEPKVAAFFVSSMTEIRLQFQAKCFSQSAVHCTVDLTSTFRPDLIARAILFAYYGQYPLTTHERIGCARRSSIIIPSIPPISELLCLPKVDYSAFFTPANQDLTEPYILHIEMQEVAHYLGMPSVGQYALRGLREILACCEVRGDGDSVMEIVEECVEMLKGMSAPVRRAVGDALRDRSLKWNVPGHAWTLHNAVSRVLRVMEQAHNVELEEALRVFKIKKAARRKVEEQKKNRRS